MLGRIERDRWSSSFARVNDPRVVRYVNDAVRLERMSDFAGHDFDLIILIDDVALAQRTLINVANVTYSRLRLILVFQSKADMDVLHTLLCCMRESLPRYSVFVPKSPITLPEMKSAGLQSVKAPHFGLLYAGDSIHPQLFERVSTALYRVPDVAGVGVSRARMNKFAWYTGEDLPPDRLVIFNTEAALRHGGYRDMQLHEYDSEWRLCWLLADGLTALPELLFFRLRRDSDVNAEQQFAVFEEVMEHGNNVASHHVSHDRES